MNDFNRRKFIKTCGLGLGVALASNFWADKLFAGMMPSPAMPDNMKLFGLSKEEMKKILEIALSKGGEFSELFFEYTRSNSVVMQEDIIKSSSADVMLGVGIRVINGEQTGYSYTNEMSYESIKNAALVSAAIASQPSKVKVADLNVSYPKIQTYEMINNITEGELKSKIALIEESYNAAKNFDSKIVNVSVNLADSLQLITIANSEGLLISDVRPQVRLVTTATAQKGSVRGTGNGNNGGRIGFDFFKSTETPKSIGEKAATEALVLLEAENAPAGEMPVVLSKHQSGVMIHEAVGHPLEADKNWKGQSIMSDKLGQMVASPLISIYDDAAIPLYRGSMNIDDEGVQVENVQLIEKGKLVNFLHDRLSAKIMNVKPNGHGRRETYMHIPIPRMNNTVLESGSHSFDEMLASTKKGFYAETYQGGMVNNTGKFTFTVNLGYLIEDGKLTKPLKNATLIGSNIDILKNVDMVADDMGFFLGTCGKSGQSVPVTAGTASLRISKMTVGGQV